MKIKYVLAVLCAAFAVQVQAASVDVRGQYKTGSERYESRVLLAHDLSNGIGGTIEYTVNNTSKTGEGIDQWLWADTEFQLYYKYKLNDAVTLIPSVLVDVLKDKPTDGGEVYKFGMQANWAFAPTWRLDGRLRYEYKNFETKNLAKQMDNDNRTRMEWWLRKAASAEVDAYYNFRWDHKLNDYQYVNKSSNYFEHNVGVSYKLTPAFKPYTEIGYLGDTANAQQDAEWRIRIGAAYSF